MALRIPPADFDPEKLPFIQPIHLNNIMIAFFSIILSTHPPDRRIYGIIFNHPGRYTPRYLVPVRLKGPRPAPFDDKDEPDTNHLTHNNQWRKQTF
jgi:hypothetical protein